MKQLALVLCVLLVGCGDDDQGDDDVVADSGAPDSTLDANTTIDGAPNDRDLVLDGDLLDGNASPDVATPDAALPIDAMVPLDAQFPCMGVNNGVICPGATDANNAERCFNNVCVGTYVAPAPAGNDSNPGTRLAPKATIAAGIAVAASLLYQRPVFVASNSAATAVWNEDVTFVPNLRLSGGWTRAANGIWTQNSTMPPTELKPASVRGLLFSGAGITRSNTSLVAFRVTGANSAAGQTAAITITNGAAPTLTDLIVVGGSSGATSLGMEVSRGTGAAGNAGPYVIASSFTGGPGDISIGLVVDGMGAEVRQSQMVGGTAVITSRGLGCVGCTGLRVLDTSTIRGTVGQTAEAMSITGDTTGIQVTSTTLIGGGVGTNPASDTRNGVRMDSCTGPGPVFSGSTILGSNGGNVETARGVYSIGCAIEVRGAAFVAGVAPGPGAATPRVTYAYGVLCEGTGSRCRIIANGEVAGTRTILGGTAATASQSATGIRLEGAGDIEGLAANLQRVLGGTAPEVRGVHLSNVATTASSTVGVSLSIVRAGDCPAGAPGLAIGMTIEGNPRVENSVILGGNCLTSEAVRLLPAAPVTRQAELVNNHIDAAGLAIANASSRGVVVADTGATGSASGALVNNTILAGLSADRAAIQEESLSADLSRLSNNNLYAGGAGTLYRDEDALDLVTADDVNTFLPGAGGGPTSSGNISGAPLVDTTFHLNAGSPNLGKGVATVGGVTAPTLDFDGAARPSPPDIGPDER